VIGTNEHHVVISHLFDQLGQPFIEIFECCRIAFDVASMSVQHVEIDEIRKHERTITRIM